jgi:hypothetical protein
MTIDFTATSPEATSDEAARPGEHGSGSGARAIAWHRVWPWVRLASGPLAAVVAILVLMSGAIPVYTEFTIGLGAVYALLVLSLSMLSSWTGIWSIGHPALLAIGAYAVAYGSAHGWSLLLTILVR